MRTITTTAHVPAEDVTVTTFGCDACDFTADDKDAVTEHHAKEHACKAEMQAAGRSLYRFDTEADADAWLDVKHSDWYQVREVDWDGPGWYATETWTQPCPRGCCRDSCVRLFSATQWVTEKVDKARDIMRDVADVRRALREAGCATG